MYEQVEKSKEHKSRAVANSVAQKKSNVNQGFGFVDNRPSPIVIQRMVPFAGKLPPSKRAIIKQNLKVTQLYEPTKTEQKKTIPGLKKRWIAASLDPDDPDYYGVEFDQMVSDATDLQEVQQKVAEKEKEKAQRDERHKSRVDELKDKEATKAAAPKQHVPQNKKEPADKKAPKPKKENRAADFFSGGPAMVQKPQVTHLKATNPQIQGWIASRPSGSTWTTDSSMHVGPDTVYIYATLTLPAVDLTIPTYNLEIHYHPVPTSTNYLHVKRTPGASPANYLNSTNWMIGAGVLVAADAAWDAANPTRLSKKPRG